MQRKKDWLAFGVVIAFYLWLIWVFAVKIASGSQENPELGILPYYGVEGLEMAFYANNDGLPPLDEADKMVYEFIERYDHLIRSNMQDFALGGGGEL